LLGFLPGTGDAQDVTVAGGYAFVASNPFGLSVANVSSLATASVVGASDVPFVGISVAASGSRVALMENVAGATAQLRVLDVSNMNYPVVTATMPTGLPINNSATGYMGVALNSTGTMALMAMGSGGVWVVSLTDPTAPVHVGTFATTSTAYAVALNSTATLAYVVIDTGLKIINLSQCQPPFTSCVLTQAGSLSTSGTNVGLAVFGTMAYLVNQNHAMYLVDVSNPAAPLLKAGVGLSGAGRMVSVDGNRAAVLSNGTTSDLLDIIDVTTPTAPTRTGSVTLGPPGTAKGVDLTGGLVYVAANGQGVTIYSPGSSTSTPAPQGTLDDTFAARAISVTTGLATVSGIDVATSNVRLKVLNVADPNRPTVAGELGTGVPNTINATGYTGVVVNGAGTMAVMAMGTSGIWVVDLTRPAAPNHIGSFVTSSSANAVALNSTGTLAYVAINTGLQIVNLAQCQPPFTGCVLTSSGTLGTTGTEVGIAVSGTMAYLSNQNHALYAVDVTNPAAPVLKAGVGLSGGGRLVAVNGNRAAVLSNGTSVDYLDVIDVSTPSSPSRVGSTVIGAPGTAKGVDVVGNRVYVAGNAKQLMIYDISVPTLPVLVTSGYTVASAYDVRVLGGMAYVADSPATIDIVSLGQ
jgi:hypothetical protein